MLCLELRAARLSLGLTLADVSIRTGIAAPNLSRIERGEIDPRWSTVERLAQCLDLSIALRPRPAASFADIQQRMTAGARRLQEAGVTDRNAPARLEWKAARGIDTTIERRQLAER
jgi:transcriptional regulator with XRE-family HTH domain